MPTAFSVLRILCAVSDQANNQRNSSFCQSLIPARDGASILLYSRRSHLRKWDLQFDSNIYGPAVTEILALDQNGNRLIPLVARSCDSDAPRQALSSKNTADLFPKSFAADAALAGLWLYFSCLDECHGIVQDMNSPEACFWHAILHRQEPDSGNSAYWFRRVGNHPVFEELALEARRILTVHPQAEFRTGTKWDPYSFIMFCERARQQPDSEQERAAQEIQRAEWQLLFHYCARPRA